MPMRRILSTALTAFLGLLLVSCGASRPVKFYALESPAPAPAASAQPFPVKIIVGRISASHLYNDDRIVYQTGPVELGAYEYQRWAGPPAEMIENMLVDTLRDSKQYAAIERLTSRTRGDYILRGHLSDLKEVDGPTIVARFELELELFQPKTGMTVWHKSYMHDEPVSKKSVSEVVEALQRNVQAGIQFLTADLAQSFPTFPPAH
jgi:ABC-type uncharacterized transport system auxiliary subunit